MVIFVSDNHYHDHQTYSHIPRSSNYSQCRMCYKPGECLCRGYASLPVTCHQACLPRTSSILGSPAPLVSSGDIWGNKGNLPFDSNRNAITDSVVFLASPICQMINWPFFMYGSVHLKVKTKVIPHLNLIIGSPQRKKYPEYPFLVYSMQAM